MTEEERQELIRERRAVKKTNHELFALRMDLLYKLSVANHLRESVFWLPSNIDFRGRVYPIPPHCCHMGESVLIVDECVATHSLHYCTKKQKHSLAHLKYYGTDSVLMHISAFSCYSEFL